MMSLFKLLLLSVAAVVIVAAENSGKGSNGTLGRKQPRLFSVYQVIRFPNDGCSGFGTTSLNGTCYTLTECTSKGGSNGGTCAQGYGVCCLFSISCGQSSSQNCTYFTSNLAQTSGTCSGKICPLNSNICQLRLDFTTFSITGPSTSVTSVGGAINGQLVSAATKQAVTTASQCITDSFSVTTDATSAPPVICGINNGQHMYVQSSSQCNNLVFQLGQSAAGTAVGTRLWNIKVTQFSCDYSNLAPSGCTQFFFGSATGTVQTFNFNNGAGRHLADQSQAMCVRKERGQCRICWSATITTDFSTSGTAITGVKVKQSKCCQYGAAGTAGSFYDCATIPFADKKTALSGPAPSRICGRSKGLVTVTGTTAAVCSSDAPFLVRFVSDHFETTAEAPAIVPQRGFRLAYAMDCPVATTG